MSIFALDLIIMLLLSLSVCSESIGGGLEPLRLRSRDRAGLDLDTLAAKLPISVVTGLPDTVAYKLLVILYVVLPYFALFILRVYVLHKAQQFPARHNTQAGKQRPTKRRRAHAARAR